MKTITFLTNEGERMIVNLHYLLFLKKISENEVLVNFVGHEPMTIVGTREGFSERAIAHVKRGESFDLCVSQKMKD